MSAGGSRSLHTDIRVGFIALGWLVDTKGYGFWDRLGWTFGFPRVASWPRASVPFHSHFLKSSQDVCFQLLHSHFIPATPLLPSHFSGHVREAASLKAPSLDDEASDPME